MHEYGPSQHTETAQTHEELHRILSLELSTALAARRRAVGDGEQVRQERVANSGAVSIPLLAHAARKALAGEEPGNYRLADEETENEGSTEQERVQVRVIAFLLVTPFSSVDHMQQGALAALSSWHSPEHAAYSLAVYPIVQGFHRLHFSLEPAVDFSPGAHDSKSVQPELRVEKPDPRDFSADWYAHQTEIEPFIQSVVFSERSAATGQVVIPLFISANQGYTQSLVAEFRESGSEDGQAVSERVRIHAYDPVSHTAQTLIMEAV